MLRTAQVVPGTARKDRSNIMATPFTHLLAAAANLAMVYSVVAVPGNAWAGDANAVAHAPAELVELVRWHSGLTVTSSDVCVNPEWKSTLTEIDPEDSTAIRVLHGAAGLRDVREDGFDYPRNGNSATETHGITRTNNKICVDLASPGRWCIAKPSL